MINAFIVSSLKDYPLLELLLESLYLTSAEKIVSIVVITDALISKKVLEPLVTTYTFLEAFKELNIQQSYSNASALNFQDGVNTNQYSHQMFLKLNADRFFAKEYPILVLDADFVAARRLCYEDIFDSTGRPFWHYKKWDTENPAEMYWKVSTEALLQSLSCSFCAEYCFMDTPSFILLPFVLKHLREHIIESANSDNAILVLLQNTYSEYIMYAAYAHEYFRHSYSFLEANEGHSSSAAVRFRLINQGHKMLRLSRQILSDYQKDHVSDPYSLFYCVWSHWEYALPFMHNTVCNLRLRSNPSSAPNLSRTSDSPCSRVILDIYEKKAFRRLKDFRICYADGWIFSSVEIHSSSSRDMWISLQFIADDPTISQLKSVLANTLSSVHIIVGRSLFVRLPRNKRVTLDFRSIVPTLEPHTERELRLRVNDYFCSDTPTLVAFVSMRLISWVASSLAKVISKRLSNLSKG